MNMRKVLLYLAGLFLIVFLPFLVLIRGAVLIHIRYNPGAYLSLLAGVMMTTILLTLYLTFIHERWSNQKGDLRSYKNRAIVVLVFLMGFCVQGLFFISSSHMKEGVLKEEIRHLHPIIRVALNTIVFIDKNLIITDAGRRPEDYMKMGLPSKKTSLHYRQKDGYAYAIDLRTNKRTWLRNFLLRSYFRIMGFRTLRHTGTADHLHVSLKCHYLPRSY